VSDCILWAGCRSRAGYGLKWDSDKHYSVHAHRWVWEQENGPIPPGHHAHHTCFTRACVNTDHLEILPAGDHSKIHHPFVEVCPKCGSDKRVGNGSNKPGVRTTCGPCKS